MVVLTEVFSPVSVTSVGTASNDIRFLSHGLRTSFLNFNENKHVRGKG